MRPVSPDSCIDRIKADVYAAFGVRIRKRDSTGESPSGGEPDAETMNAGRTSDDAVPSRGDLAGYESTCGAIASGGEPGAFPTGTTPSAANVPHEIRASGGFPDRGVSPDPLELQYPYRPESISSTQVVIAILEARRQFTRHQIAIFL